MSFGLTALSPRQLRERAAQDGCTGEEIEAARNSAAPKVALTDLIISNEMRNRAAAGGCTPQEIAAAWRNHDPHAALTALIVSNTVRKQAIQEGCLPPEIEAVWSGWRSPGAARDAAMNRLISQHSTWRTEELPQQLAKCDATSLVELAKRTPSIKSDAVEDARDDEAPKEALARLLLGAPEFVAEQRRLKNEAERQRRAL